MIWFDMMVIPTDAPHPENSCAFLDYFVRTAPCKVTRRMTDW